MMAEASTDVTYCTNEKCERNCWRKVKNYRFNEKELYWFMDTCEHARLKADVIDNHIPHID